MFAQGQTNRAQEEKQTISGFAPPSDHIGSINFDQNLQIGKTLIVMSNKTFLVTTVLVLLRCRTNFLLNNFTFAIRYEKCSLEMIVLNHGIGFRNSPLRHAKTRTWLLINFPQSYHQFLTSSLFVLIGLGHSDQEVGNDRSINQIFVSVDGHICDSWQIMLFPSSSYTDTQLNLCGIIRNI